MEEQLSQNELAAIGRALLDHMDVNGISESEVSTMAEQLIEISMLPSTDQLAEAILPLLDDETKSLGKAATAEPEDMFRGPEVITEISNLIDRHTMLLIVMAVMICFRGPISRAIDRLEKIGIKTEKLKVSAKFQELRKKADKKSAGK